MSELDTLRARIDDIDQRLIRAISDRAEVVQAIGQHKRQTEAPVYVPHRERQVLDKVRALNPGPLSDHTIEAIYRELMSGSLKLEAGVRVGFMGPPGSFSHLAATRHFGQSVDYQASGCIEAVFEAVLAGEVDYGLVPYENAISGGITDTLDAFVQHPVTVCAETPITVRHALLGNGTPSAIRRIHSKPQIFHQCRRWLHQHYPQAEQIAASSSSAAVALIHDRPDEAAIGSVLAGTIYGVRVLAEPVQDNAQNVTRFLVLGQQRAEPTGHDKTTLMFVTRNTPGALVEVLLAFRDAGLNLSHIEKRPSQRSNWEYTFFVDCEAHRDAPAFAGALRAVETHCLSVRVLGSYPRGQATL